MEKFEYATHIWDLRGIDPRPDAEELNRQLQQFGAEGWELVSATFNVELARHGESHFFVFKRRAE